MICSRPRSRALSAELALSTLGLQLGLVLLDEVADLVGHVEQPQPLLLVERHREATQAVDGDAALLKNAEAVNGHSWPLYWLGRIGHGAFFAAAAFWIGAAWYRFRLRLAGIKAEDIWLVRRIYLSAAMVYAIPIILKALVMSFIHDTPLSAAVADPDWQTRVYAFFPLWSTIVGYIGVRTVYRPRGPGASWCAAVDRS